ncbi:hypothetical protein EDC04DRAFT_755553 [Pisolithus marmoratus]|nr:hypothetical protein EDC04DRAFT_755553 [Pisolithus marmoratus]
MKADVCNLGPLMQAWQVPLSVPCSVPVFTFSGLFVCSRETQFIATLLGSSYTCCTKLTWRGWLLVLYDALHCIQAPAFMLCHFIVVMVDNSVTDASLLLLRVVRPALKGALRSKHELVCTLQMAEVAVHAVSQCARISSLLEMQLRLAVKTRKEASSPTCAILKRRSRALR